MRFSCVAIASLALSPFALAAPVRRGLLSDIGNGIKGAATEVGNLINSNATLAGVAGTVVQSVENPQLTAARITVLKGLSDMSTDLNQIGTQANATGNTGVATLANTAQTGISSAHVAINNIGEALVSGTKPSIADQKTVAVGIKGARDAVNQMTAAITTPDSTLTSNIATAQSDVTSLQQGGEDVLSADNLTFADLGLPDNFADS
ncbi:hypothetical protein K439DRAFT_1634222 [Ramaria rubella]|nr:hypothetical protein K439DRAFT_1634222 [Ramaria rubella]